MKLRRGSPQLLEMAAQPGSSRLFRRRVLKTKVSLSITIKSRGMDTLFQKFQEGWLGCLRQLPSGILREMVPAALQGPARPGMRRLWASVIVNFTPNS